MVTVAYGSNAPSKTPSVSSAAFWVPQIKARFDEFEGGLRSSLEKAIALGAKLNEAKAKLPHGEFGKLFRDHATPVEGAMPFRSEWAQRLMRIAENEVVANPDCSADLPSDLNAIYQLSLMAGRKLQDAIESGDVRPDMTVAEAKKLVQELEPERKKKAQARQQQKEPEDALVVIKAFEETVISLAEEVIAKFPDKRELVSLALNTASKAVR